VRYASEIDKVFKAHGIEIPEKVKKNERHPFYCVYNLGDYCGLPKDFVEYIASGGFYGR